MRKISGEKALEYAQKESGINNKKRERNDE